MNFPVGPESRFTNPRPDCLRPDYWSSADDDSTEIEVSILVGALVTALQPEFVVETGTAWGQTAEYIGVALQRNGHGRLVTLEPDPDRATYSIRRCTGLPVTVLTRPSLDYIPEQPVDFAWFDSLTDLRHQEFLRYGPYYSQRCVIGFHDTGPQHPVRPMLDVLVKQEMLQPPLYLPTPRGVCFARVQGPIR